MITDMASNARGNNTTTDYYHPIIILEQTNTNYSIQDHQSDRIPPMKVLGSGQFPEN